MVVARLIAPTHAAAGLLAAALLLASSLAVLPRADAADYGEILTLYRSGKYAECVDAAAKAIADDDFRENFRLLKIRSEIELGRYADAIKTLDEALKRFGSSIELRWV